MNTEHDRETCRLAFVAELHGRDYRNIVLRRETLRDELVRQNERTETNGDLNRSNFET
jgi:hypothetical protein